MTILTTGSHVSQTDLKFTVQVIISLNSGLSALPPERLQAHIHHLHTGVTSCWGVNSRPVRADTGSICRQMKLRSNHCIGAFPNQHCDGGVWTKTGESEVGGLHFNSLYWISISYSSALGRPPKHQQQLSYSLSPTLQCYSLITPSYVILLPVPPSLHLKYAPEWMYLKCQSFPTVPSASSQTLMCSHTSRHSHGQTGFSFCSFFSSCWAHLSSSLHCCWGWGQIRVTHFPPSFHQMLPRNIRISQAPWYIPVLRTLRRGRQEDHLGIRYPSPFTEILSHIHKEFRNMQKEECHAGIKCMHHHQQAQAQLWNCFLLGTLS